MRCQAVLRSVYVCHAAPGVDIEPGGAGNAASVIEFFGSIADGAGPKPLCVVIGPFVRWKQPMSDLLNVPEEHGEARNRMEKAYPNKRLVAIRN